MDDFGLGYSGDWLDDVPEDERDIIIPKEIDELDGFHIVPESDIVFDEDEYWASYETYADDYDEEGPESVAEVEGY